MRKRILSLFIVVAVLIAMNPEVVSIVSVGVADSEFTIENGILTKYIGSGSNVVIPEGVTSIGDSAFYGCTSITSIIIPDGVTNIGHQAFIYCTNLTEIIIPILSKIDL